MFYPYLIAKYIHILSSVILVGTGFGTAFYLFYTNRIGDVKAIATVAKLVVRADTWFTTPAVIVQPLSGLAMVYLNHWNLSVGWLFYSIVLYFFTGACWLPVVWLQLKMRDMAVLAVKQQQTELPAKYWRYARLWELLGYPAFVAMLIVFFLMSNKPF